jgi:hypothetical protein
VLGSVGERCDDASPVIFSLSTASEIAATPMWTGSWLAGLFIDTDAVFPQEEELGLGGAMLEPCWESVDLAIDLGLLTAFCGGAIAATYRGWH